VLGHSPARRSTCGGVFAGSGPVDLLHLARPADYSDRIDAVAGADPLKVGARGRGFRGEWGAAGTPTVGYFPWAMQNDEPYGRVRSMTGAKFARYRARNVINTYGVTAPYVDAPALFKPNCHINWMVGVDERAATAAAGG
jgi:hypothetical protein